MHYMQLISDNSLVLLGFQLCGFQDISNISLTSFISAFDSFKT